MVQRPARKHHLNSEFFLRRFANHRDQVAVYDKARDAEFPRSVVDAAVETDFYTVEGPDGPSDFVEREVMGSGIEGPAKVALERVDERDDVPRDADRRDIALFIALQFTRGHLFREMVEGVTARVSEMRFPPSPGSTATAEQFAVAEGAARAYVDAIARTQGFKVGAMLHMTDQTVPHLMARAWTLVEGTDFVTSDLPVICAQANGAYGWGVGIATAHFIAFPISPTRAFLLTNPGTLREGRVMLPEPAVESLRLGAWGSARRFVFRAPTTSRPPATPRN